MLNRKSKESFFPPSLLPWKAACLDYPMPESMAVSAINQAFASRAVHSAGIDSVLLEPS